MHILRQVCVSNAKVCGEKSINILASRSRWNRFASFVVEKIQQGPTSVANPRRPVDNITPDIGTVMMALNKTKK